MLGMRWVRIDIGLNLNHALAADPHLGRSVSAGSSEAMLKAYAKREYGLLGDVAQGEVNLRITAPGDARLMRPHQVGRFLGHAL